MMFFRQPSRPDLGKVANKHLEGDLPYGRHHFAIENFDLIVVEVGCWSTRDENNRGLDGATSLQCSRRPVKLVCIFMAK